MRRKSVSAPNPLRCEIEGVTLRDLEFSAALGSLTGTLLFGGLRSVYKQMRNQRTQWALTREEMKDCVWLKPQVVAQIEFTEWTPDGHLRHSKFAGLRQDKDPKDVVREIAGRKVVNSSSH